MGALSSDASSSSPGLVAFARGAGLTLAGGVASVGLGFALTLVLTHGLGARGTGVFFVAIAIFAVLTTIAMLGADIGCVRMVARYEALERVHDVRAIVAVAVLPVLAASTLLALAGLALANELGGIFASQDADEVSSALRVLLPLLPFAAVSMVLIGASRGLGTMVPHVAIEQLGKPLARLVVVALVVALGAGIDAALVAWAACGLLAAVASVVWLLHLLRGAERATGGAPADRARPRDRAAEFWRFASVRGLTSIPKVLVEWLDVILVGALTSAAEAGVYAAVTRLVRIGSLAQRATILALGPRISALFARDERAEIQTLYRVSTTWLVALSFPAYLVLAFFSPEIVRIFGEGFSEGALPLTILALAMLVDMATGPVTTILLMAGKASWVLGNMLAALAVNVGLNLLLIPRYGMTGAAIAWAASILVQNLAPAAQIAYGLHLHPLGAGLFLAAGGAVAAYGAAGLVGHVLWPGAAAAVVLVAAATLVYGAIVWRCRELLSLGVITEAVRLRRPKATALAGAR